MLVFICARESSYADIKKYGLRQSGMGHRLIRSFDAATKQCTGRLLAVELGHDDLKACKVRDDVVIAPAVRLQSFRNLNPYAAAQPVTAAGGVVTRHREGALEVLMIRRRGVWDLPKGKIDPGESIEECAQREVCEELGVDDVRIVSALDRTLHGYRQGERFMVKTTHWFLMRTAATKFRPQAEERIEKVKWMEWKQAKEKAGYETVRDILKSARSAAQKQSASLARK